MARVGRSKGVLRLCAARGCDMVVKVGARRNENALRGARRQFVQNVLGIQGIVSAGRYGIV